MNQEDDNWLFKELENLISKTIFFNTIKAKIENSDDKRSYIEFGYDYISS